MSEATACPFCGGINIMREGYHQFCYACGASGPDADTEDDDSTIAAWNRRAPAAPAPWAVPVEQPKSDSDHLTSDCVVRLAPLDPGRVPLKFEAWLRGQLTPKSDATEYGHGCNAMIARVAEKLGIALTAGEKAK